ncbi:MAG: glycosyltransferase [Gammaproteobacteria bacterium]|nr:glycosyltransferase [Gammaproteobacteria bacterium]
MSEQPKTRVMLMNDSLNMGGAETMIFSLICDLDAQRITPYALSMSVDDALKQTFLDTGIPVYECPKGSGLDWRLPLRIAKILRREKIDILHTHNFASWLWGGLASLFAPRCKLVHTQHSNIVLNRLPPKPLRSLLARISKKVVTVSDPVAEHLQRDGFVPANKLQVIYNGIPLKPEQHSKDPDYRHLAIVARLVPVKNHDLLIRSFAQACQLQNNIKLDILGDGPLRDELQQLSNSLGMGDKIKFWGEVPNARALMTSFDAFVLSSLSEGLSISILEALAAGLPVIATDVGGNGTLIHHQKNGLLVPSEDQQQLATSINRVLADEDLRTKMGQESLKIVTEGFSNQTMVDHYQQIYAHALGRIQL